MAEELNCCREVSELEAWRAEGETSKMSVLAWIVLGLVAGFVASNITKSSGQGMLLDLVLGIVGAVVGGYFSPPSELRASQVSISTALLSPLSARSPCFGFTTPSVAARFDPARSSGRSCFCS